MGEALRVPEGLGVAEGIHRAVDLTREAARGYSSTQVETEHLLLGQNLDTMSGTHGGSRNGRGGRQVRVSFFTRGRR